MTKTILGTLAFTLAACGGSSAVDSQAQQAQTQAELAAAADGGTPAAPPPGGAGGPRGPHGPPPEALAACEGKASGDVCSVTFRDGAAHAGTCSAPPARSGEDAPPLGCRPDDMPGHGGPHGPPPAEAFTACDGKAADAACSVTLGDHTLDGTCRTPPPGVTETRLACAPAGHGPHGDGPDGGPPGPGPHGNGGPPGPPPGR